MNKPKIDTKSFKSFIKGLSKDELKHLNQKDHDRNVAEYEEFKEGYKNGICYLCGKPFKTISKNNPCIHWLLRQCKFKKKDSPKVFGEFDYHQVAAFLRWVANQERFQSNINDLNEEKSEKKVISYTIKWKNIEWTFDCSKNDYDGHGGSKMDFPHYHFQVRIDGRQFINFKDYHIPFSKQDIFTLELRKEEPDFFHHSFGFGGSGMQEAVEVDPNMILANNVSTDNEKEATYHIQTIVMAEESPISGEVIQEIIEENKRTGKLQAHIAQEKLKGKAKIRTIISPVDTIPDIAKRPKHKRK
jgi:hypothetical protein